MSLNSNVWSMFLSFHLFGSWSGHASNWTLCHFTVLARLAPADRTAGKNHIHNSNNATLVRCQACLSAPTFCALLMTVRSELICCQDLSVRCWCVLAERPTVSLDSEHVSAYPISIFQVDCFRLEVSSEPLCMASKGVKKTGRQQHAWLLKIPSFSEIQG